MLSLLYRLEPCSSTIGASQLELRAPDIAMTRARYEGCRFFDHSTMPTRRGSEWSKLVIVLRGEVASHRVLLREGDALLSRTWDDDPLYPLTLDSDAVKISWRGGGLAGATLASGDVFRLSPALTRRVTEALAFEATGPDEAHRRAGVVLGALGALGLPFSLAGVAEASRSVTRADRAFAAAMTKALFPLSNRPMMVDVARLLGVSERQAMRRSNELFRRTFPSVDAWRDFVSGWRLARAVMLLSDRSATTDGVARELGFASPTGLCHAFARIGWDSPQKLRERFAQG